MTRQSRCVRPQPSRCRAPAFPTSRLQMPLRSFFMFIRLLDKTQWYHSMFKWSTSQNCEFLLGKSDILFQVLQVVLKVLLDACLVDPIGALQDIV
jgi:hypothetical protein